MCFSNEARALTHRFPPSIASSDDTLLSSKALLRAVWSRDYALIYRALQPEQWPDELAEILSQYLGTSIA